MYIPPKFKIDDPSEIHEFIHQNSFGLLLSVEDGIIHDTHTPFIISDDGKRLLGHIAKANPQWSSWNEDDVVKVIFNGPHTYISPKYYVSEFAVPTWNYAVVSVSGKVTLVEDDEEKLDFLDTLTAFHEEGVEGESWSMDRSDERYMKLLAGLIVFSVEIDSVEAVFKMNFLV